MSNDSLNLLAINPRNGKIYRHPVILKNGRLEEMREAQKRDVFDFIRFRDLEDHIREVLWANPDLHPRMYTSDKTPEEALFDYLLNPKKGSYHVEKFKGFDLMKLGDSRPFSYAENQKFTSKRSVWELFQRCHKMDLDETLLHLWKDLDLTELDTPFPSPEFRENLIGLLSATLNLSSLSADLQRTIQSKIGKGFAKIELDGDEIYHLVEKFDDVIALWKDSEMELNRDTVQGVFSANVSDEKKLDLITFLAEKTGEWDIEDIGPLYLQHIVRENPLFRQFFCLIPKEERKRIIVDREILVEALATNNLWDIITIFDKLVRHCRVEKRDLFDLVDYDNGLIDGYFRPLYLLTFQQKEILRKWCFEVPVNLFWDGRSSPKVQ